MMCGTAPVGTAQVGYFMGYRVLLLHQAGIRIHDAEVDFAAAVGGRDYSRCGLRLTWVAVPVEQGGCSLPCRLPPFQACPLTLSTWELGVVHRLASLCFNLKSCRLTL